MTTQQTALQRYRRPRGQYPKRQDAESRPKPLPEYLEGREVDALIRAAPNARARLLFLVQWRAGLRVSEALALEVRDLSLDSGLPTIHVRQGKGAKPRVVPVHPELHSALASSLQFGNIVQGDKLIRASRSTADRWIRSATTRAEEAGAISPRLCQGGWGTRRYRRRLYTWSWFPIRQGVWQRCYESGVKIHTLVVFGHTDAHKLPTILFGPQAWWASNDSEVKSNLESISATPHIAPNIYNDGAVSKITPGLGYILMAPGVGLWRAPLSPLLLPRGTSSKLFGLPCPQANSYRFSIMVKSLSRSHR